MTQSHDLCPDWHQSRFSDQASFIFSSQKHIYPNVKKKGKIKNHHQSLDMREEAVNVHIQAGGTDRQRRQKGKRTEEILKSMKYWTWPLTSGCWCMEVKRRCVCIQLDVQSRLSSVCLLHMTHVCFLLHSRVASVDKLVPDVTLPPVGHLLHSLSVSLPSAGSTPCSRKQRRWCCSSRLFPAVTGTSHQMERTTSRSQLIGCLWTNQRAAEWRRRRERFNHHPCDRHEEAKR